MYIVTKYWTNGEDWEDFYDDEIPVAYYDNIEDLLEYASNNGWIDSHRKNEDISHIMTFSVTENKEDFICPYNKNHYDCQKECWGSYESYKKYEETGDCEDNYPEVFFECEEYVFGSYDNSSTSYKIYDIKGGMKHGK